MCLHSSAWAQERPIRADALLSSSDKVASLAALADSADYLADVIGRSGAMDVAAGPGGITAAQGGGGGGRAKSGAAGGKPGGMLTVGMAHLMDRRAAAAGLKTPKPSSLHLLPACN